MSKIHKIHGTFKSFWKDYEPKDLVKVSKSTLELMGIKPKGDGIEQIKKHWANVVNFLYKWEGKPKKF